MNKNRTERIKKWIALLLAAVMIFSLAACGKDSDSAKTTETDTPDEKVSESSDVILPFSREDGINPFQASSLMNRVIMPLLYSGLYSIDSTYKPKAVLAKSAVVSGKTVTVTLDSSQRFSDGSSVQADDVVYSFEQAADSSYYKSALSMFSSAKADETQTNVVVFKLKNENQYAAADLTFPIVEANSAESSTSVPVGTGRYTYKASDRGGVLTRNTGYSSDKYSTEQIYLSNMSASDSLLSTLNIGNIDATFDDLSTGSPDRITASTSQVPLNNMVIIWIKQSGTLANATVRQYLSDLISRSDLISSGMDGYGEASSLPFEPNWYASSGVKVSSGGDTEKEKSALKEALKDDTLTIVTDKSNDYKVKMASALADQLKTLGISTTISSLSYSSYSSAISSGNYDLAIAEYKLTDDMDISSYITSSSLTKTYKAMLAGTQTVQDFATAYRNEMPFITVGFRNGIVFYRRSLSANVKTLPNDPYANIDQWFAS